MRKAHESVYTLFADESNTWITHMNTFLSRAPHMRALHLPDLSHFKCLRSNTVRELRCGAYAYDIMDVPEILRRGFSTRLESLTFDSITLCDKQGSMEQWTATVERTYLPRLRQHNPDVFDAFRTGLLRLSSDFTLIGIVSLDGEAEDEDEQSEWSINDLPVEHNALTCMLIALLQQGLKFAVPHVTRLQLQALVLTRSMVTILVDSFVSVQLVSACIAGDDYYHVYHNILSKPCVVRDECVLSEFVLGMPCLSDILITGQFSNASFAWLRLLMNIKRQKRLI